MKLSGHTRPFAVLGHPIGHTLSPVMHNAAFQALGLDAVYMAFDVAPDRLMATLPAMGDMGFGGVNLTVPLKQVAYAGLTDLDMSAQQARAVNTLEFTDSGLRGHNTDGIGFLRAYEEAFGEGLGGKRICILGTGGSARGVGIASAGVEAGAITVCGRHAERTLALADELSAYNEAVPVMTALSADDGWRDAIHMADVVIHTTPVGMNADDVAVVDARHFRKGQHAYDLIYMTRQTLFTGAAQAGGAEVANGLGMLLHQGAVALSIWLGVDPPLEVMRTALEAEVYGRG